MTRLRGRSCLTVIVIISFTLLIVIYHILSDEANEITSNKMSVKFKFNQMFSSNDHSPLPNNENTKSNIDGEYEGSTDRIKMFNDFSRKKIFNDKDPLFKGHKIVHLDLKGAPPLISYYKYLLRLLNNLGATGILIEYEDMFPFKGKIQNIAAKNAYSELDIATIQKLAQDNDLIVIPLIQTFGHLEFVLKLELYKDLREIMRYPQVVCPTNNKTLPLLYEMIDQVISLHPHIRYLHIGADEVYQIGDCNRCMELMLKKQWGKRQLFLDHVSKIIRYIKNKYPDLTILMWDDEFREISPQDIIDKELNKMVQPVVWKYTTDPGSALTDQLWENYASVWKDVWGATAFKGATAPDKYYTNISYHLENHRRWLEIIQRNSDRVTFKGVILTGWQRYDHFSVLCELLPSALPSLAVSLAALQSNNLNYYMFDVPNSVMDSLECKGVIQLSYPEPQYTWSQCNFLGASIYDATYRLFVLLQEIERMEEDSTFKGWLKDYNIEYAFSNPSHVERAVVDLDKFKIEISSIEKDMRTAMEEIYDKYTIDEWITTYLVPVNKKLTLLWEAKEKILERNSWPRRPLTKSEL